MDISESLIDKILGEEEIIISVGEEIRAICPSCRHMWTPKRIPPRACPRCSEYSDKFVICKAEIVEKIRRVK